MNRLRVTRAVILILLIPGCARRGAAAQDTDIFFAAATDTYVLVAQDTRFDPRLQLDQSLRLGIGIAGRLFSLAGGFGVERAEATGASVGYSYPGWSARSIWLATGLTSASGVGIEVGARGLLAGFDSTFLVVFFPVVVVSPTIRLPLGGSTDLNLGIPLGWQMRSDLAVTVGRNAVVGGVPFFGISMEIIRKWPRLR